MTKDEEGGGEDADEERAEGGEAGGYYVVGWFVDGPDCPDEGGIWRGELANWPRATGSWK